MIRSPGDCLRTAILLASALGWLFVNRPVAATSVMVIPPSARPPDAAIAVVLATDLVADLKAYDGIEPAVLDPASPAIQKALKGKSLLAQDVRDPVAFGAATHIAQLCGADYVVFGTIESGGPGDLGGGKSSRVHLVFGDALSGNINPVDIAIIPETSSAPAPTAAPAGGPGNVAPDSGRPRAGSAGDHPSPMDSAPLPSWVQAYAREVAALVAGRIGAHKTPPLPSVANGDARWGRAQTFLAAGQTTEAAAELAAAIAMDPGNGKYKGALAGLELARGQVASAIALYQDAATDSPFDADIRLGLGSAMEVRGDQEGALAAYREAVRLAPEQAGPHLHLGKLLLAEGAKAEALQELELAARGKDAVAGDALVSALVAMGDWDRAEKMIRANIEASPDQLYPRSQLAGVLMKQNKFSMVLGCWLDALQAHIAPGGSDLPTLFNAANRELGSVLDALPTASAADLKALKDRSHTVSVVLDALTLSSMPWKRVHEQCATAVSEALQAIVERQQDPDGATTAGDVTMLVSHARQLLSPPALPGHPSGTGGTADGSSGGSAVR